MSASVTSTDALDQRVFRRAVGRFSTGVTAVTALTDDGQVSAMTANSFTSVSLDPPLVLVCVRHEGQMAPLLVEPGRPFAISVLSAHQGEVATALAGRGRDLASMEVFCTEPGEELGGPLAGVPVVAGARGHLACEVHAVFPGGDHHIVVGRVTGVAAHEGEPLMFVDGELVGTHRAAS
ncbi:flavin reductase family protein [Nocardioides sp. GY 10127]|uniref:flavin reductase family protein n=1 Tax=Nocardioides sp. GY 10127 TaxID=2569762 RepID=UPI0014584DF4|nr:flavin reductase family protein [Nocardioides sp. GY 10127]